MPLPETDEGAHDLDVDGDGAVAAKHAREHRNALLGERVGPVPRAAVAQT